MKRRKGLVVIMALALVMSFSSFAFADGWLSYEEKIDLDTTYDGYFQESTQYETWSFEIPVKGKVSVNVESPNYKIFSNRYYIYSANNVDAYIDFFEYIREGYSSARDVNYGGFELSLPKGKYYLVTEKEEYDYEGEYEFSIDYTPNISGSKITKLEPKKNGFKVNLKKSGTATGYQIKYSANKNMSNAKTVKTTKSVKTIKGLKKGKKYYVKVRAYRNLMVNGMMKTYYSKWSARKSVKTK